MLDAAVAEALTSSDRHIAITGAGGWLGKATLDLLSRAFGASFHTRVSCYGSFKRTIDLKYRQVEQYPLTSLADLRERNVWVIHLAFQTKERVDMMSESAYRKVNDLISSTVLDALDQIDVAGLFVASSGAATKADDPSASKAMRLYGQMKRADELRFSAWSEAHGRRVVIGRLYNLTGPYINKLENYAIASFIRDAQANRPITVHAPHEVIRSYVAIRELMSLVFSLLGDGGDGSTRFDSGGEPLELGAIARAVVAELGEGQVERAAVTDPSPDRYIGDGTAYAALLGHFGIPAVALDQQIRETASFLGRETDAA